MQVLSNCTSSANCFVPLFPNELLRVSIEKLPDLLLTHL